MVNLSSDGSQPNPLLATKLFIPPTRFELVPRPRLTERLNQGMRGKLTLISAPAGFGKTTLLSEWAENSQRSVAWLSLEEGDNDPTHFLAYFVAALQTIEEGIGETALAMLQSPQPPPVESVLTSLINEIAAIPDRIVLVLDDYHLIEAQPIHDALTFTLDHLPPQMRLVITTRSDPPLPRARLRGRGQLTELRSSDLRFTSDETAGFLNRVMDLALSEEDVATLAFRTEGWITGLQMAAISMQGRDAEHIADFIRAFTGSNRYVLDYLVEEVLDQRPQGTQDFLLQTSVLNRLSGPLCDAVTGQSNGQHILEQLEQANLFIVRLDDERHWYRYHHLFADLLRSQLSRLQPDLLPMLHRRAGEWFEQAGLLPEAVHHA
jgi:LuxR family maltose regulon positive regulatory protein